MKQSEYVKHFDNERDARNRCAMKNSACKRAGNYRDIYCLVDGPDDLFSVVDLITAIDLSCGYEICDMATV